MTGTEEGKNKVKNEEKNECEMPLLPKEKTVTEGKKDGDENATTDLTDNEEDQRQDSTAVEQSVQNETEVKKEQQDNTTNTANSSKIHKCSMNETILKNCETDRNVFGPRPIFF